MSPPNMKPTEIESELEKVQSHQDVGSAAIYGTAWANQSLPRAAVREGGMPSETAYQLIKSSLARDGTPGMNLASFVSTYMEERAERLMLQTMPTNMIDYEEYPATTEIQNRCVAMLAGLLHAPGTVPPAGFDDPNGPSRSLGAAADGGDRRWEPAAAVGTSTIGSSEAIMLAVLAMKRRWQRRRKAAGLPTDRPNLVMNSAVQVCWEKAARYFEVEERYVYCTERRHVLDPVEAVRLIDENTIGVCAILGTTFTGEYEDVAALAAEMDAAGVPAGCGIHVDAASGGFVAPFVNPALQWDFQVERVVSINLSGHKYGLVYPGVGWCVWRGREYLPDELVFHINYLGADQASFTLNFSRGASGVVGQYYQLVRLGRAGYRAIMLSLTATADYLAGEVEQLGFELLSATGGRGLPLVAFRLPEVAPARTYDEYTIAHRLREKGWIVPAYTMAPHADHMRLMRVVVRQDFSQNQCDDFVADLKTVLHALDRERARMAEAAEAADRAGGESRVEALAEQLERQLRMFRHAPSIRLPRHLQLGRHETAAEGEKEPEPSSPVHPAPTGSGEGHDQKSWAKKTRGVC